MMIWTELVALPNITDHPTPELFIPELFIPELFLFYLYPKVEPSKEYSFGVLANGCSRESSVITKNDDHVMRPATALSKLLTR